MGQLRPGRAFQNAMHEVFMDDDGIGISTVNRLTIVAQIIIGLDRGDTAKLLLPVLAIRALPAGIYHHAHTTQTADYELSGMGTQGTDTPPTISCPGTIGKIPSNHSLRVR
jgi:hypothetical protein